MDEKFDDMNLQEICKEFSKVLNVCECYIYFYIYCDDSNEYFIACLLKKHSVHLSLVSPKSGLKELEEIPSMVSNFLCP